MGDYSFSKLVNVTILAIEWNGILGFLIKELAEQLARLGPTGVKISVLVPESAQIDLSLEIWFLEKYGVTIVKAKRRLGFLNPIDWLYYPPEDLKTDIVIGIGEQLGKIAQHWKERYQCKNIYIDLGNELLFSSFEIVETFQKLEVNRKELSIAASIPVAIGPRTTDDLSASLRSEGKQASNLTPGIISIFSNLNPATNDGRKCRVLLVGGDNPDNFLKDGLKTAADAVAKLKNNSYHLIYVGAGKGTEQQFKDLFHECGVSNSQLRIRNLPKTEDEWKKLFCEVDLAIMPSSDKEFGLEALLALSAGLPVLVHGESGFGEALRDVTFGTSAIVDSDDAGEWASRIKTVRETDRKSRLKQAATLRSNYDEKYSWVKQLTPLVAMMIKMVSGMIFIPCNFFTLHFL